MFCDVICTGLFLHWSCDHRAGRPMKTLPIIVRQMTICHCRWRNGFVVTSRGLATSGGVACCHGYQYGSNLHSWYRS